MSYDCFMYQESEGRRKLIIIWFGYVCFVIYFPNFIQVPVGGPSEVDEIFDIISYSKGASVIRMLHGYIGDEVGEVENLVDSALTVGRFSPGIFVS